MVDRMFFITRLAMLKRLMVYSVYLVLDFKLATFNVCDNGIVGRRAARLEVEFLLKCSMFGSKSFDMALNAHSPTPYF
tara:strand:+ start:1273 stop:1506 length:234 start_codon:yes stop_codon:yes gene_type:complete